MAITDDTSLLSALSNCTFNAGFCIINFRIGSNEVGTVMMSSLDNAYGQGVFFGYYYSGVAIVRNANRSFSVSKIA